MIFAPLSESVLVGKTWLDSAALYELAAGPENLANEDPKKTTRPRGTFTVVAGDNDRIDFMHGGGDLVATVPPATYGSPNELGIAAQTVMRTASGNDWTVRHRQSTGAYGLWTLTTTFVGTSQLLTASGANTARNILVKLMGFRNEDRTHALPFTGDFVANHGPRQDLGTVDTASTSTVSYGAFIGGIDSGPSAAISVGLGITTAATDHVWIAGEKHTRGVVCIPFTTLGSFRYARFTITDPHRGDRCRVGAGLAYLGRWHDTDRMTIGDRVQWEWQSFSRVRGWRSIPKRMKDGGRNVSEVQPGERFRLLFGEAPGLSPAQYRALEPMFLALGRAGLCFVNFDLDRPASMSRLVRVVSIPAAQHLARQSRLGRFSVPIELEAVN